MIAVYFWTPLCFLPPEVEGIAIVSAAHIAWLLCALLFCGGALRWFRRAGGDSRRRFLHIAAMVMVISELIKMAALALSGGFSPADSLPLHLCGVMVFVEWYAVLRRCPLALELCWSLGLPGAFSALITPGETSYPFWNFYYLQFILAHTLLFLIPLLLWDDGFRPQIRRLPKCFLFLLGLASVDAVVNHFSGGNYLFLSAAPPGSLLDAVAWAAGPWYLPAAALSVWLIWLLYYGIPLLFHRKSPALSHK